LKYYLFSQIVKIQTKDRYKTTAPIKQDYDFFLTFAFVKLITKTALYRLLR